MKGLYINITYLHKLVLSLILDFWNIIRRSKEKHSLFTATPIGLLLSFFLNPDCIYRCKKKPLACIETILSNFGLILEILNHDSYQIIPKYSSRLLSLKLLSFQNKVYFKL